MTKQAKIESSNERELSPRQIKLRSSGPLLPEPAKVDPIMKKPALIGEKEFDEMKIIREFQIKRKLLMKILKQKQKQKTSGSAPIESFQVKEGILQFHDSESQQPDSAFVDRDSSSLALSSENHVDFHQDQESPKENLDPNSTSSEKIDVAIQTDKDEIKRQINLKSVRQNTKEYPITQKKISKQGGKIKRKKTKKTKQDIQRIKNQITSLFVTKQSEGQSSPQISSSQCQSLLSSLSGCTNQEYLIQVTFMIQKLNKEIETFYTGRYLTQAIMSQYKQNYARRKYNNPLKTPLNSSNQSMIDDRSLGSDCSQANSQQPNSKNKVLQIQPINNRIQQEKASQTPKDQSNNSNTSKTSKRKNKGNRGLINDRFPILGQKSQKPIKKETLKKRSSDEIKNEPFSSKNHLIETQPNDFDILKSRQMSIQELSDTESQVHHSKAWIKEFNMEVELIYEKYPKLRKYQLSRKISNSQNKQIQIDQIEDYCEKKTKKITKKVKIIKNEPIQKAFKEKIKTIAKGKNEYLSHTGQGQQRKKQPYHPKKKLPKLKEIEIGNRDEEEFCKSFDHRSRKGQKILQSQFSQIKSHDLKDNELYNQIYDVLCDGSDYKNKSHQFYFSSGTENELSDSLEKKSAKLENKKEQISRSMSKSHVGTSSEMSGERKKSFLKNIEHSFFKSEEGKEYFYMSGDNPLNF